MSVVQTIGDGVLIQGTIIENAKDKVKQVEKMVEESEESGMTQSWASRLKV